MTNELISRSQVVLPVAGVRVTVPYAPAGAWLEHLDTPYHVVYQMADAPSRKLLSAALIDVPGADEALSSQSLHLLQRLTGRARWWEGVRLAHMGAHPDVLGRLVLAGVDPWSRSLGEWCAAMYTLATKDADEKALMKFEMQLSFPPEGHEDEWDDGEDFEQMAAAMRELPGMA